MNLAELQSLMWRAITWPTGAADFIAQADAETRQQFETAFVGSANFDAVSRMEVYANAYYWRLHAVLAENYPMLAWLLGEVGFRNLTTDYLLAHPSTDPDLRHLGAQLPKYLEAHDAARGHPGLVELANAEAAMGDALHAKNHAVAHRSDLTSLSPDTWPALRLHFAPTLRQLNCRWSLDALAHLRSTQDRPPALEHIETSEAGQLLIWRRGFRVKRRRAAPRESEAIVAFREGSSFGELCAMMAMQAPDGTSLTSLPATLATWIGNWVDSGMLCAIAVDPTPPER